VIVAPHRSPRQNAFSAYFLDVARPRCLHRLKVNRDSGEGEHRFRAKVNSESAGR